MENVQDVLPIGSLTGKSVLSVQTGNKLGELRDLIVDPVNGIVLGLIIAGSDGDDLCLPYGDVYSFGHDAVMALSDAALRPSDEVDFANFPSAGDLIGTKMITVSGNLIGNIRNVFVTVHPPPVIIYSLGESLLDRLLGREIFLAASSAYVFSDDAERLVVPDDAVDQAGRTIEEVLDKAGTAGSFDAGRLSDDSDDTQLVPPASPYVEPTAFNDEFETELHSDDDDTVIRLRPDVLRDEEAT